MDNMKGKIAWMDSMDFDHELGIAPETELFASEQSCRKRKTCIAKCEASPDPTGYNCRPQRVIVFDADEYENYQPALHPPRR